MSARDAAKIPKRIQSIKFGLLEPNEIRKMSAVEVKTADTYRCLLYTSPSPRDLSTSRMPSSA